MGHAIQFGRPQNRGMKPGIAFAHNSCGYGACASVRHANVPRTWIPMDLDPANVLMDEDGRVRFIDVDDSFYGPAPLAMATYARRCGDRAAYRAYEDAWPGRLAAIDWRSFGVVASVIDSRLGWERMMQNIERGEVQAELDLVRTRVRERLTRAICGRLPCPATPDGP